MRQFTRKEILADLRDKVSRKEPIIIGGAGVGLIAKITDSAGIDLIMAYNTGPFRMDGNSSSCGYLAYGDANAMTLRLGEQILDVVEKTPVIGGIGAADPYRNIDRLIGYMMEMGFSGITNVPTAGAYDGQFGKEIDAVGIGYPEEVKLISKCSKRDVFTVAYAYDIEQTKAMVAAGVDVISPHVGGTKGGMIGFDVNAVSIDEACERTQKMYEAAIKENPDVIVVCHGGPYETPEDVQICFDKTDVMGFIGASSIERLPVERAITQIVQEYKSLRIQ